LKPFGFVAQNVLELCPKVCLHKAYIHPNLYQMRCPICLDAAGLYLRTLHNLAGCYFWRLLQGMFGFAVNAIMEPSALQTIHTVPIAMFISVVADVELGAVPTPEYSAPQARKGYYTTALSDIARLVNVCPSHQKPEFGLHCFLSALYGCGNSELCLSHTSVIMPAHDHPLLDAGPLRFFVSTSAIRFAHGPVSSCQTNGRSTTIRYVYISAEDCGHQIDLLF
jgi:hypothetical protein